MNKAEIMSILPHRDSMLLLDSAQLGEDGAAYGEYTIKGTEWFLDGHFPGDPVVPGVIQCEIIAQASCVLFADQVKGKKTYYAGIDKVRFRRVVRPGDTLSIRAELIRQKFNLYIVKGEARVGGELSASGEFTFMLAGQEA